MQDKNDTNYTVYNRHKSDLIQYQTGNGLRHASGPVQPIHLLHRLTFNLPSLMISPKIDNIILSHTLKYLLFF